MPVAEGNQRKIIEILRILRDSEEPLGAKRVADSLRRAGVTIGERAVRYYFRIMDERGLTEKHGYAGRTITERGVEELSRGLVSRRIGFVISRVEEKIYSSRFDPSTGRGEAVVNTTFVGEEDEDEALSTIREVFESGMAVSPHVSVRREGELLAGRPVSAGRVGIATLCSMTMDGVLLKRGVPITPRFGGVVEVSGGEFSRFTDAISYEGSSVDPVEVFMETGMTSVGEAMEGDGRLLGNLRVIPRSAQEEVVRVVEELEALGIGGVMDVGLPNRSVLGIPVGMDRFGVAMSAGINTAAALNERGIDAPTEEISGLVPFEEMERL
ncbi:MAG: Global nitrogen regulator NrpRI [Methanonatronarchaeales archaeon]|nr:Global nitrogen regulator NrpRI [Methanonatronarchaeales archaeon]